MKINILLDIDGVLANFYAGFGGYLNRTYGAGLDLSTEPENYSFNEWGPKCNSINTDKATVDWILEGGFRKTPAYDGVKEFVEELNKLANVSVVTARIGDFKQKFGEEVVSKIKEDTATWFQTNKIPVKEVIFEHKKIDFCKANAISALIEDKLETVLTGSKEGMHCILVNRAWNQHPDRLRVYRSYNYNDVLNFVRKMIK